MQQLRLIPALLLVLGASACSVGPDPFSPTERRQEVSEVSLPATDVRIERVSTAVPFPRGLALVGGKLHVLCRGRARQYGGVNAGIDDQAGTLYQVDPNLARPFEEEICEDVANNGVVLARPTAPPFRLFDRSTRSPTDDRETDRPYCTLRWHEETQSFYICAFSGIDKDARLQNNFSKNLSDAVLRYDMRTGSWHEIERHDIEAGGLYPHHDPARSPAPHGWLNGPDNCLAVGTGLYVVAKDNSCLVRYDLSELIENPEAGFPKSEWVLGSEVFVEGHGTRQFLGHSALASDDDWLYIAFRTTSEIVRIPIDAEGRPVQPIRAQLVARFQPWDPEQRKSANLTDIMLDSEGCLYVLSAQPARVHRFFPDPRNVYDARDPEQDAWLDMASLTGNPKMKSENILVDDESGCLYITAGDAYDHESGTGGVIYRVTTSD